MITRPNSLTKFATFIKIAVVVLVLTVVPLANVNLAGAAQITGRNITLSSSAGDATGVTYTLTTAALPAELDNVMFLPVI